MSATVLLAALAGAAAVLAAWEALQALATAPGGGRLLREAIGPWTAVGHGAALPGAGERRRLGALGALTTAAGGGILAGPVAAVFAGLGGPGLVAAALRRRRARWRTRVVAATPFLARAMADALAGGHTIRGAVQELAVHGGAGPEADRELRAVAATLAVGAPTDAALADWAARVRAPAVDLLVAAILLQRDSGGDLAGLLRDLAQDLEAAGRAAADARAATAQARFTAGIVLALPATAVALAELAAPGAVLGTLSRPLPAVLAATAVVLDVLAVLAVRRLARLPA